MHNRRQFCPCICLIFERSRGQGFLYALCPVLGVKCHGKDRGTHAFMAYRHVEEIAQAQRILGKLPLIPLGWRMTASMLLPGDGACARPLAGLGKKSSGKWPSRNHAIASSYSIKV